MQIMWKSNNSVNYCMSSFRQTKKPEQDGQFIDIGPNDLWFIKV